MGDEHVFAKSGFKARNVALEEPISSMSLLTTT
jgi:hypothetical protein